MTSLLSLALVMSVVVLWGYLMLRMAPRRRSLRLEYAALAWNVVGCVIVLTAAYAARSIALAGFGIDSVIEIFASLVVAWQLKAIDKDKEYLAEQLIGMTFLPPG